MALRAGLEGGAIYHSPISGELFQLVCVRPAQHVANEQPMPGQLCHHAHIEAVGRICAAKEVLHKIITPLHMRNHILVERLKTRFRHGRIVFPPNAIGHRSSFDHMFVFWRSASEFAGGHQKGTALSKCTFFAFQGLLDERGFQHVVIDSPQPCDALIFEGELGVYASIGHAIAPKACIIRTAFNMPR